MNKFIITRWNGAVLTLLQSDKEAIQASLEPEEESSILGNIYIGKVKNIVKNINSAFVDIGKGQMGYLNLADAWLYHADGRTFSGKLKAGDELIVQVEREAVKTKAPVLSGNLNITGRYFVLTAGKKQIGFSGKISDMVWKQEMKAFLEEKKSEDFGIIVRTNAPSASKMALTKELDQLKEQFYQLIENAKHRTCYSLLYSSEPSYITALRDSLKASLSEIITDEPDIYDTLKSYMTDHQPEDLKLLTLYDDKLLPLGKLYRIEKNMEEALGKRIWLKSGGYLVIEPTEALTVIDVNTGKYAGKKTLRDTIIKINSEAALEIGHQLRLRNLSGIIIVDFIDMEAEKDRQALVARLTEILSKDPVKTNVVEITKLNLVEITRKKIRKPLYEQVKDLQKQIGF